MPRKVTLDRYEVGLVRNENRPGMQMLPIIVIYDHLQQSFKFLIIFNHHCKCHHGNNHNHYEVDLVSFVKNSGWSSCRNCGFHYYVTRRQHHEHLEDEEDEEDAQLLKSSVIDRYPDPYYGIDRTPDIEHLTELIKGWW